MNNDDDIPVVVQIQDRTGYYPFFILSLIFISLGLFGIVIETKSTSTTITITTTDSADIITSSSPLLFFCICNIFFVIGVIGFLTTDGISSPPSNGPYQYLLKMKKKKKKKKNVQQQHEESKQSKQSKSKVLVCLGDSLTHGKCSDNWIDRINTDKRIADRSSSFNNIDIVNAGQNNICTHTVLKTRIYQVTQCQPQYVFVMIGTNDVMCMYRDDWSNDKVRMWSLPTKPTPEIYEKNLRSIIKYLLSKNKKNTQIGLATLPPMGEDFNSKSNQLIKQINHIIYKVASDSNEEEDDDDDDDDDTGKDSTVAAAAAAATTTTTTRPKRRRRRVRIIEVYDALKVEIISRRSTGIQQQQQQQQNIYNVDNFLLAAMIMNVLHHIVGIKWNTLTKYVTGNVVMSDSLHLNEDGGNIVKNLVIDWLLSLEEEKEKEES